MQNTYKKIEPVLNFPAIFSGRIMVELIYIFLVIAVCRHIGEVQSCRRMAIAEKDFVDWPAEVKAKMVTIFSVKRFGH